MRLRDRKRGGGEADVLMSPLIDCVFLLLIFFLVTSQLKRYERQIPVTIADPTASVSEQVRSDAYLIGLDIDGRLHREAGRDEMGIVQFQPVGDLDAALSALVAERGGDAPVELVVEAQTPTQTVIDVLDTLQEAGLRQVRSRVRDGQLVPAFETVEG